MFSLSVPSKLMQLAVADMDYKFDGLCTILVLACVLFSISST